MGRHAQCMPDQGYDARSRCPAYRGRGSGIAKQNDLSCGAMCGRFTLTERNVIAVARFFAAEVEHEQAPLYRPRWNIAPTDDHWIVRRDDAGRRRLLPARFGSTEPQDSRSSTHAERL